MKKSKLFILLFLSFFVFKSLFSQQVHTSNLRTFEFSTVHAMHKLSFQVEMTVSSGGFVQATVKNIDVKHPKAWSSYSIKTEVYDIHVIKDKKTKKTSAIKYSCRIKFTGRRILYDIPIESKDYNDESKWIYKKVSDKDDVQNWDKKNEVITIPKDSFAEEIENYHGENNEHSSNNNPPSNQNERKIDLSPVTLTNINTFESPKNNCQLKVLVSEVKNGREYPVSNATVKLVIDKNKYGTLSSEDGVTGSDGIASFVYTSPKEDELNKTGQTEIEVMLKATDNKSGKSSYLPINVRSMKSDLLITSEAQILPAHPKYYDEIRIVYKGPRKSDAKPYKLKINTKLPSGKLVKSRGNDGGVNEYVVNIQPNEENILYYHWTGAQPKDKAEDDVVTFEMPELKKKITLDLSIGIDLGITGIERTNDNTPAPYVVEPLYVYLEDKFHPDNDLVKIFDDIKVTPTVELKEYSYTTPEIFDPSESDYFNGLWSKISGVLSSSLASYPTQLFYNAGFMPYKNGKYVLMEKTKLKKNIKELPGVEMFDRGKFKFIATITKDDWDAGKGNNEFITGEFKPEGYLNEWDEAAKKIVLPMGKLIMGMVAPLSVPMGLIDFGIALAQSNSKGMMTSYFDLFCAATEKWSKSAQAINEAEKIIVNLFKGNPGKFKSFANEEDFKDLYTICTASSTGTGAFDIIFQAASSGGEKSDLQELPKNLEYVQSILKGTKNFYLVALEKKGLNSFNAGVEKGKKLEMMPACIFDARSKLQRINEGKEFYVFPVYLNEKVNLDLDLNDKGGRIIRITSDTMDSFNYPDGNGLKKAELNIKDAVKYSD